MRRFARRCIAHGVEHGQALTVDSSSVPSLWHEPGACFVTLRMEGELRGCIGTFDAEQPVWSNVARSAHRAAFEDPRFPPVTREELSRLEVEVSLLGPVEPFPVASRTDLLARLSPGVDGLIVSEGRKRATFLPSVWESLPEPADFVEALFRKAGLPIDHWSRELCFEHYTVTKAR